jgi:hypothetical protein
VAAGTICLLLVGQVCVAEPHEKKLQLVVKMLLEGVGVSDVGQH